MIDTSKADNLYEKQNNQDLGRIQKNFMASK